jgi:hypothetical protein
MKVHAIRFVWLLSLVAMAGLSTPATSADPELQEITGYREWRRLTDNPIAVNNPSFAA